MNKINFLKYIMMVLFSYFIGMPSTLLAMSLHQFYHNQGTASAYNLFGALLYFTFGLWGTLVSFFIIFIFNALTNFEKTKTIYNEIGEGIKISISNHNTPIILQKLLTNLQYIHTYLKKISSILDQLNNLESNYYVIVLNDKINITVYKLHEYLGKYHFYNRSVNIINEVLNDINKESIKLNNINSKEDEINKKKMEDLDKMFDHYLKNSNIQQDLISSLANLDNLGNLDNSDNLDSMKNILSFFENIENIQPLNREQTRRLRKRGKKYF